MKTIYIPLQWFLQTVTLTKLRAMLIMTKAVKEYNLKCSNIENDNQEDCYVTFSGVSVQVIKEQSFYFFLKINEEDLPHIVKDLIQTKNLISLTWCENRKLAEVEEDEITIVYVKKESAKEEEGTDLRKKVDPLDEGMPETAEKDAKRKINSKEDDKITVIHMQKEENNAESGAGREGN
ncbi:uncharacterized protein LOC117173429 isoform X1 [Belonocnema kinseyi]|uniref:uncharacterized protein LOC117173429 isoform X1 n=1 Tax=Belonocnema kinseyi TaxID=2817044 RepID=UPI00143CD956|nr:uncharacterized protein LOC117173429 isoform X1 [Belonocnema kinseyi]XP_033217881.1 uncharacterized protein LOC117173429 isoform X1 [Belonocnema kinseyi]